MGKLIIKTISSFLTLCLVLDPIYGSSMGQVRAAAFLRGPGVSLFEGQALQEAGLTGSHSVLQDPVPAYALRTGAAEAGDLPHADNAGETLAFGYKGELVSTARNINAGLRASLSARLQTARERGLFGVLTIAMEMRYKDKTGAKMKVLGPGGGGQGMFMEEMPAALAHHEGVATAIASPLFYENLLHLAFGNDVKKALADYGEKAVFEKALAIYLETHGAQELMDIELPVGRGTIPLKVLYLEQDGVPVIHFVDPSGTYFRRLYDSPKPDSVGSYVESILLPMAAVEATRHLGIEYEVAYSNDWQAALTATFLTQFYANEKWPLGHPPTRVFTVHNLEYQGIFPNEEYKGNNWGTLRFDETREDERRVQQNLRERGIIGNEDEVDVFALTNLNRSLQHDIDNGGEYWSNILPGRHNFFKMAILSTIFAVFVSVGHSLESLTVTRGYGQNGLLNRAVAKLTAVLNGVHAQRHRPENLAVLDEKGQNKTTGLNYAFVRPNKPTTSMSGSELHAFKNANQEALQIKLGLEVNPKAHVMGFVSRMVKQKGMNVLMTTLEDGKTLLEHMLDQTGPDGSRMQVVIEGTVGDVRGEEQARFFREFLGLHPQYQGQFVFVEAFDPVLAKQIGAGSKLGGMFSIDEPGGIANQELALLFCMMLVSDRGGLNDFYKLFGTPFKPVSGFEINNPLALPFGRNEVDVPALRPDLAHGRWHDRLLLRHLPKRVTLRDASDEDLFNALNALIEKEPRLAWRPELDSLGFPPQFFAMRDRVQRLETTGHRVPDYEYRLLSRAVVQVLYKGETARGHYPLDTDEGITQRERTSHEIIDRIREFLGLVSRPQDYERALEEMKRFRADWSFRTGDYVKIFLNGIEQVSPGFIERTSANRAQWRVDRLPGVDDLLGKLGEFGLVGGAERDFLERVRQNANQYQGQNVAAIGPAAMAIAVYAALSGAVATVIVDPAMADLAYAAARDMGVAERVIVQTSQGDLNAPGVIVLGSPPGATGLVSRIFRTRNVIIIGAIEGYLQSWLGHSSLADLVNTHSAFDVSMVLAHASAMLMAGFMTLFLLHYFSGVVVDGVKKPVKKDYNLSMAATWQARWGFAGWPAMAVGFMVGGPLGWAIVLAGFAVGPVLHGWANPQPIFAAQEFLHAA